MSNKTLSAALFYRNMGYSVIPIKPANKKSFVKWTEFQHRQANEAEIKRWWKRWPKAMVAIVTGKISGVTVLDPDTKAGIRALDEFLPDSLQIPTVTTPRGGRHYWFWYTPGIPNKAKILKDCDVRNDGGYVIAPPSINGDARGYDWVDNLKPTDILPPTMPTMLADTLRGGSVPADPLFPDAVTDSIRIDSITSSSARFKKPPKSRDNRDNRDNRDTRLSLSQGGRDEAIFHLANLLVRSGAPVQDVEFYVKTLANVCDPPFPEKECLIKIRSALARNAKRSSTSDFTMSTVREFVAETNGDFSVTTALQTVTSVTNAKSRMKLRKYLSRLVKEGVLERNLSRDGVFKRIIADVELYDLDAAPKPGLKIFIPFGAHQLVKLMPDNVAVIAGETDAGKTAFLMNVARYNCADWKINYINSEGGQDEFNYRANNFDDFDREMWVKNVQAFSRETDFHEVIMPGEGVINIIDYLELHSDFWLVSKMIAQIQSKLKGAVVFIGLQKNRNTDQGLGGFRSMEKARLYLAMERGNVARIVKAKNWVNPSVNPNNLQIKYKVWKGVNLSSVGDWHRPGMDELRKRQGGNNYARRM